MPSTQPIKQKKLRLLPYLLCVLFITKGFTQQVETSKNININSIDKEEVIGLYTSYYHDESRTKTIKDITKKTFTKSDKKHLNFGFDNGANWLRFSIKNAKHASVFKILRIQKPLQDSIQLYYKEDNQWKKTSSGFLVNEADKKITGASIYFPIHLKEKSINTYYIRSTSKYGQAFNMTLIDNQTYLKKENIELIIISLLIGALLTIAAYNFILGISLKDNTYIYYSTMVLLSLLTYCTVRGFMKQYILGDNYFIHKHWPPFIIAMGTIAISVFCIKFLNTKKHCRSTDYLLKALILYIVTAFIYQFVRNEILEIHTTNSFVAISVLIFGFVALYAGIRIWLKGNKFARFYIYSWAVFCTAVILYVGTLFNFIPINTLTINAYMGGSILEVILLSLALADRYHLLQKEKEVLKQNLNLKKEEIVELMKESIQHIKTKSQVAEDLKKLNLQKNPSPIKGIIADLKSEKIEDDKILILRDNINSLSFEFKKRLTSTHSGLTNTEIEICCFIKIGLSRNEIANTRNTTLSAVKMSKSRIKKKLKLPLSVKLDDYLNEL